MAAEPVWPGVDQVEFLFAFGGSFTQTQPKGEAIRRPTAQFPLGTDWPGETFNEAGQPNWVGHLVTKKPGKPLLVYNYANSEQNIQSLQLQIQRFIQSQPDIPTEEVNKYNIRGKSLFSLASVVRPSLLPRKYASCIFAIWPEWHAEQRNLDVRSAAKSVFKNGLSPLYGAGARNFLILSTPPHVKPSAANPAAVDIWAKQQENTRLWNEALDEQIKDFKVWFAGITIFKVDLWHLFEKLLSSPQEYGFSTADATRGSASRIWVDSIHVKSAVHEMIADAAWTVMKEVNPRPVNQA